MKLLSQLITSRNYLYLTAPLAAALLCTSCTRSPRAAIDEDVEKFEVHELMNSFGDKDGAPGRYTLHDVDDHLTLLDTTTGALYLRDGTNWISALSIRPTTRAERFADWQRERGKNKEP